MLVVGFGLLFVLTLRLSLALRLGLALGFGLALGLGLPLGRGPLFALRRTSLFLWVNVAVLLLVVARLIFSARPVHFVGAVLVRVAGTSRIPIFRLVTIHVVGRIDIPVFRTARVWIDRGISVRVVRTSRVPIFRRSGIPVFGTVQVPVGAARGAIVRPIEVAIVGAVLVRIISASRWLVGSRVSGRRRSGFELTRSCSSGDWRAATILGSTHRGVAARSLLLLHL